MEPQDFFDGHPRAWPVFERVRDVLAEMDVTEVRTSRSQVAFRRRRGVAYLWMPGRWLTHPTSEVVLSIGLGREIESPRFKEVAHPTEGEWMHHLEIHDADEVDAEVVGWLREAAERSG